MSYAGNTLVLTSCSLKITAPEVGFKGTGKSFDFQMRIRSARLWSLLNHKKVVLWEWNNKSSGPAQCHTSIHRVNLCLEWAFVLDCHFQKDFFFWGGGGIISFPTVNFIPFLILCTFQADSMRFLRCMIIHTISTVISIAFWRWEGLCLMFHVMYCPTWNVSLVFLCVELAEKTDFPWGTIESQVLS